MTTWPSDTERANQMEKALRTLTERLDKALGVNTVFGKIHCIDGVIAAEPDTEVTYPSLDRARADARNLLNVA